MEGWIERESNNKPTKKTLKKDQILGFQDRLSLNAGKKYCRMLPLEHSAIRLACIKRYRS